MAGVNPACVGSVLGFGRDVRGMSSSERVRVSLGRKSARVSEFVGSIRSGATRCSSLPGDGASAAVSKSLGKSTSGKNLRWMEEDVAVASGVEGGVRSVSVVQALPEDVGTANGLNTATEILAELLDSDRPQPVGGYGSGNQLSLEILDVMYRPKLLWFATSEDEENRMIDRAFNALLAGAAISYAFTKAVTVDHDVWHGWTMFEVLKYAPLHCWHAYEEVLQSNPLLAKMTISGIVYSIGDWIGQVNFSSPFCS
jgi:hypothetical protein